MISFFFFIICIINFISLILVLTISVFLFPFYLKLRRCSHAQFMGFATFFCNNRTLAKSWNSGQRFFVGKMIQRDWNLHYLITADFISYYRHMSFPLGHAVLDAISEPYILWLQCMRDSLVYIATCITNCVQMWGHVFLYQVASFNIRSNSWCTRRLRWSGAIFYFCIVKLGQ